MFKQTKYVDRMYLRWNVDRKAIQMIINQKGKYLSFAKCM